MQKIHFHIGYRSGLWSVWSSNSHTRNLLIWSWHYKAKFLLIWAWSQFCSRAKQSRGASIPHQSRSAFHEPEDASHFKKMWFVVAYCLGHLFNKTWSSCITCLGNKFCREGILYKMCVYILLINCNFIYLFIIIIIIILYLLLT